MKLRCSNGAVLEELSADYKVVSLRPLLHWSRGGNFLGAIQSPSQGKQMSLPRLLRREFFGAAAPMFLAPFNKLAAAEKNPLKIRDVRTMTIQGPTRTYLFVKVVADDG